jgi:type I restriction enzyme S subunit
MTANEFLEQFGTLANAPGGFKNLRTLILELAFQGRFSSTAEATSAWEREAVEDVSEILRPGFSCNRSNVTPDGHVHLRTHNVVTDGRMNLDLIVRIDPALVDRDKATLKKDDILFNNTNSQELVGKTCIVEADCEYGFSNHLTQIRLKPGYVAGYVVRFLNLLWRRGYFAGLCNRWIGQAGINTKALSIIEIPFPTEAEQKRIVAKVDRLMALCDALEARQQARHAVRSRLHATLLGNLQTAANAADFALAWQRLRDHIAELFTPGEAALDAVAQLRQTILQLAVQGKLVPQDTRDERAASAAADIDFNEAPDLFAVPSNWRWTRLRNASISLKYGTSVRCGYDIPGVPVLRIPNVVKGRIDIDDLKRGPLGDKEQDDLRHEKGDLLIIRSNGSTSIVGRTAVVDGAAVGMAYAGYLVRLRQKEETWKSAFLHLAMSTIFVREQIEGPIRTTSGVKNINSTEIGRICVPVPPLAEQQRIVAKMHQLMAQCDALEASLKAAATVSERWSAAAVRQLLDGAARPVAAR